MSIDKRIHLSASASAAMDVIRATAAIYVAIYHIAQSRDWLHGAGQMLRFGQEAVIIFFVLSGVVIYANEWHRLESVYDYFKRRIKRLYPCLLAAIVVSILVSLDNRDIDQEFSGGDLLGTLFSMQDINTLHPGAFAEPFLKNSPLWTLSYEMSFYILFPMVMLYAAKNIRSTLICCISVSAYISYCLWPNHLLLVLSYFPIWWVGAEIAMAYAKDRRQRAVMLPSVVTLALLALISASIAVYHRDYGSYYRYPILHIRHFVLPIVLSLIWQGAAGDWFSSAALKVRAGAQWLSSISYGIYIFHYPLTVISKRAESLSGLLCMMIVTVMLAYIFDRKLSVLLRSVGTSRRVEERADAGRPSELARSG